MPSPAVRPATKRTLWSMSSSAQRAAIAAGSTAATSMPAIAVTTDVSACGRHGPAQRHDPLGTRLVERHDRPADVAGVQVAAADVGQVDVPHDAHAGLLDGGDALVEVVDLEDRHVPAVAAGACRAGARPSCPTSSG